MTVHSSNPKVNTYEYSSKLCSTNRMKADSYNPKCRQHEFINLQIKRNQGHRNSKSNNTDPQTDQQKNIYIFKRIISP